MHVTSSTYLVASAKGNSEDHDDFLKEMSRAGPRVSCISTSSITFLHANMTTRSDHHRRRQAFTFKTILFYLVLLCSGQQYPRRKQCSCIGSFYRHFLGTQYMYTNLWIPTMVHFQICSTRI